MKGIHPAPAVRIGIVGGNGHMGRWLRRFWEDLGYLVVYSDRGTGISNEDVVRLSDITFISVPLRDTPEVIGTLASTFTAEQALVSIASLMEPSVAELEAVQGESICAHPVFGPTVRRTRGLPIAVAGVRGNRWRHWLEGVLTSAGLDVLATTPQEHDASMAIVQAMLHSTYVALCRTMSAAALPPTEAIAWGSPTLRAQMGLVARILGQDPNLYADLVVGNPHSPARLEELASELNRLAGLARAGDRSGFAAEFEAARESFGDSLDDLAIRAEAALEHFA